MKGIFDFFDWAREQSEEKKRRLVTIFTVVFAVLLFILWLFTLHARMPRLTGQLRATSTEVFVQESVVFSENESFFDTLWRGVRVTFEDVSSSFSSYRKYFERFKNIGSPLQPGADIRLPSE